MHTPVNPSFYYIKAGFKGIKMIEACFRDMVETDYMFVIFQIRDTSVKDTLVKYPALMTKSWNSNMLLTAAHHQISVTIITQRR